MESQSEHLGCERSVIFFSVHVTLGIQVTGDPEHIILLCKVSSELLRIKRKSSKHKPLPMSGTFCQHTYTAYIHTQADTFMHAYMHTIHLCTRVCTYA